MYKIKGDIQNQASSKHGPDYDEDYGLSFKITLTPFLYILSAFYGRYRGVSELLANSH
jgi:hypothetical protein